MKEKEFKAPFRVGKKSSRSVLDCKGLEVVVFPAGLDEFAAEYVNFLNKIQDVPLHKEKDMLSLYETKFWQILRMHSSQIDLKIQVHNIGGALQYDCDVYVYKQFKHSDYYMSKFSTSGANLWKRYKEICEFLARIFGDNLYNHNAEPLKI